MGCRNMAARGKILGPTSVALPSKGLPGLVVGPAQTTQMPAALQILEPGRRERLGLKMANEAAAKNRAKKQEALRRVTENLAR